MSGVFHEIARRDPILWATSLLQLALAVAFPTGLAIDDRVILGVNPWFKPLKFAPSITIYLWIVAWLLGDVSARPGIDCGSLVGGERVASQWSVEAKPATHARATRSRLREVAHETE